MASVDELAFYEIKGNETGSYLSDGSHRGRFCIQSSQCGQKGNDQREENVTAYAAIVISESVYQMIMEYRNKGNAQYTKNVATFYIIGKNDSVVDLACYQGGPKYTEVIIDEDMITTVNGVKDKDAGDRLQIGQRVLFEYGWEDPKGHFVNPNSLVVY